MPEPGKTCDEPGCKNSAVVHLTQVVNNKISTHHLCQACATAKGINTAKPTSSFALSDFLAQLGETGQTETSTETFEPCDFCGLTFPTFKETGRLGCSHCYSSFEKGLRRLLTRIHGGSQHVGKVYLPPNPTATDLEKRLDALRRRLNRAVDSEDFERAAVLRDQIRALEPAG
ncbi:MAG: UvrB/UvrC motif-containing protein [Longimicrobiales bacterium]